MRNCKNRYHEWLRVRAGLELTLIQHTALGRLNLRGQNNETKTSDANHDLSETRDYDEPKGTAALSLLMQKLY